MHKGIYTSHSITDGVKLYSVFCRERSDMFVHPWDLTADDSAAEVMRGHSPRGWRKVRLAPLRHFVYHLSEAP
jgi:hypothetical protein